MHKVSIPEGAIETRILINRIWSWCDQNICLANGKLSPSGSHNGVVQWAIFYDKGHPYVNFHNRNDAIKFRLAFVGAE